MDVFNSCRFIRMSRIFVVLVFGFSGEFAVAFLGGVDCGRKDVQWLKDSCQMTGTTPGIEQCFSCVASLNQAVQACEANGLGAGATMLTQVLGASANVQGGEFGQATPKLDGASAAGTGGAVGAPSSGGAASVCSAGSCPACKSTAATVQRKMGLVQGDIANAAGNAAQTGAAASQLKDSIGPMLIGAGLGALAGYMLGGDDEEKKEEPTEEKPPEIPPPPGPAPTEDPTSSSSSSSIGNSSSSSGIETPAVVNVPVIDTNAEGGGGQSEIIVGVGDAIVDDGQFEGESSSSSSEGGSTTVGGSTGGSTGNGTEVVVNDDTSANDEDDTRGTDVVVENDGLALVGSGRGLAGSGGSGFLMGGQESSAETVQGSGSGMVVGVPVGRRAATGVSGASTTTNTVRGLAGAAKTSSSSSSARTAAVTNGTKPATNSNINSGRSREEIRADLRRRGLID